NALTLTDVDAGAGPLELALEVGHGTLTLGALDGLTFSQGTGIADPAMTFTGTPAALNAALDGLAYAPAADFNGDDMLPLAAHAPGPSGAGGAKPDALTVALPVTPVNAAPAPSVPGAQPADEDTPLTVNGFGVADVDAANLQMTLSVGHGVVTLHGAAGLTF